ncbi:MAG: L-threonylcarbamoyladenylate synthase [Actinomycetia bacterium]|nr:L-threonylcarbamoyladenylate synthase [Actinomycetes bacterium]
MSPVFDCATESARREGLSKAADAVRDGKLIVLPTDTLYGVGADAFNRDAVEALLAAKGRGRHMPPPVLIGDRRTIDGLATDVPSYARDLVEQFWPGPLTIILKAQPSLSWDLGDTNGTVALRMPDHELALELLREVGPLAVSSANVTGWPAARTMVDAATQLGAAVFIYLDGGPVGEGLASTIVDCTTMSPAILREGALSAEDLAPFLPGEETAAAESAGAADAGTADAAHDCQDIDSTTDTSERPTPHE